MAGMLQTHVMGGTSGIQSYAILHTFWLVMSKQPYKAYHTSGEGAQQPSQHPCSTAAENSILLQALHLLGCHLLSTLISDHVYCEWAWQQITDGINKVGDQD